MAIPLQFLTKSLSGNPTPLPHEPFNSGSSQASDLVIKNISLWVFTYISVFFPFLPPKCGGDAPPVVYILKMLWKIVNIKNKIIVVLPHLALKIEDNFHNKCGGEFWRISSLLYLCMPFSPKNDQNLKFFHLVLVFYT